MSFIFITDANEITLPDTFRCPICKAAIVADEVVEWNETDDGSWEADTVKINCETEPDIDSDEWWPWHNRHWSMPYVYWLPLEEAVTKWVNERYRWKQ